jgi:IS5 family transposase
MPWSEIEAALAPALAHKDKSCRTVQDPDLFGTIESVVGASGVSPAGRPRLPIWLMVAPLYLKHAFNESDQSMVQRWSENVVWQLFIGMEYYSSKLPATAPSSGTFARSWAKQAWSNCSRPPSRRPGSSGLSRRRS